MVDIQTRFAEPGLEGVSVKIFGTNGTQLSGSPVSTNASGVWTYTMPGGYVGTEVIVEFVPPTGYQPGITGSANGTSVRKITLSGTTTDINFTAAIPNEHTQDNPTFSIPCVSKYTSDLADPSLIGTSYNTSNPYIGSQNGQDLPNSSAVNSGVQPHTTFGTHQNLGTVNGVAFDKLRRRWLAGTY